MRKTKLSMQLFLSYYVLNSRGKIKARLPEICEHNIFLESQFSLEIAYENKIKRMRIHVTGKQE